MGCIARLGCLVLLIILACIAWLTRDRWLPMLRGHAATEASAVHWEPLTDARAERAKVTIDRLRSPRGPVFANLSAGEAASYVYRELAKQLPASTDSAEAAVIGDRLYIRASVRTAELGPSVLGGLGGMFGDRERVMFGGSFHVIRPELAEYQLAEVRIHDFRVPQGAIPKLIQQIKRGGRPDGVSPNALPLVIPKWVADVRITAGHLTVYKAVSE